MLKGDGSGKLWGLFSGRVSNIMVKENSFGPEVCQLV